jgi:signal peptidase II
VLIAGGAVGNMIDRLLRGYVTDFLYFSLIDFPVFNVADCYVCIGAAVLALALFTRYKEDDFHFLLPERNKNIE